MKTEHEQLKEMQGILRAELDREAKEILAELEANESLRECKMPEDSEEDLMQRIQKLEEQKSAYELVADADKEAIRLGREMQFQKADDEKVVHFKPKKTRLYLLVAAIVVLVMAMGMVSIGEVPLVTRISAMMAGEKELKNVDSERENMAKVVVMQDENVKVYEEIRDAFDVDIIKLDYRPCGTEILMYQVDKNLSRATITYQCGESILNYRMIFNYHNQSYGYKVDNEMMEEKILEVDGIVVRLKQYDVEDITEISYVAEFTYQDAYYVLTATAETPEAEMEEILKNLKIF